MTPCGVQDRVRWVPKRRAQRLPVARHLCVTPNWPAVHLAFLGMTPVLDRLATCQGHSARDNRSKASIVSHNHSMRILYVTLQGLDEWQGAGTHVRAVTQGLATTDEVELLAPAGNATSLFGRLWTMAVLQLRALRRARRVDVVYLRHHPFLLPLTLALKARGIPVVHELNGPIEDFLAIYPMLLPVFGRLRRMSVRTLLAADAVVVVSLRMREYLGDLGVPLSAIEVVHNGADLNAFRPSETAAERRVVFVGAFSPWQGLDTLVDATNDPAWPRDVRLVVAGHGTEAHELSRADPATLDNLGIVPHAEVGALVSGAMATISPKTPASALQSPLKLYESVACAVPAVVTDVGEQADFVRDTGTGLVVPPQDPAAMAKAIALLADDEELRAGMSQAATALRWEVSWDCRVAQIRGLLLALTGLADVDQLLRVDAEMPFLHAAVA